MPTHARFSVLVNYLQRSRQKELFQKPDYDPIEQILFCYLEANNDETTFASMWEIFYRKTPFNTLVYVRVNSGVPTT